MIKYFQSILAWLKTNLSSRQYLIMWSFIIGLTAGTASVLLKTIVHYIQTFLKETYKYEYTNYFIIIFPLIGIFLTIIFIRVFLKGKFGKGSAHVLHSIAKKSSFVERHMTYSHIVTSALTVGFGGSAGLEAPIVVTGSAIGANYGRINLMNYKERTLMLASGAAAGIAAVFNAPIAGVMFALEVLLTDITINTFIPILIASAAGALCSSIILQEGILLSFSLRQPFNYYNVPFYILLGIITAFFSIYYSRLFLKVESFLRNKIPGTYSRAITGGILLGIIILLLPPLYGEGYDSIKILAGKNPERILEDSFFSMFSGNNIFVIIFVFVVGMMKVFATSLTLSSGGNGGNFAPSLFAGAFIGFAFAKSCSLLGLNLPVVNFTIVAMAGVLTGIMHAPLTGIFLIAEVTGSYSLMIPLMIVSALTYALVKHYEPYSIDKKDLARTGDVFTYNRDKNILTMLDLPSIIEKDFSIVSYNMDMNKLSEIIAHSTRNIFPVVDKENKLLGIITINDIREFLFEMSVYKDILAIEIMRNPQEVIEVTETMDSVMQKFDKTGAWNLPVVDKGGYIGFISKSSLFTKYRNQIISNYSEE